MKSLLTVTPNPALDLTGHLPTLKVGSVNLMTSGHLHPAGKGLNVARVLRDLGAEVAVSGFLGAENRHRSMLSAPTVACTMALWWCRARPASTSSWWRRAVR